ncbi:MAG: PrsW family intramembrane metalloprotease [Chloroflexi bacterium]|nr:PrsW family intramembrane metalloprotease [Chloroflexota bacterium]
MSQNVWMAPTAQPPRRGWRWLRALLIGLGLFIATTIVMLLTGNPNLYPTVILIGNFLVPVVFVAFLYDHQHFSALSTDTVAASFCIGGILGILGASILESLLLPTVTNPTQGLSLLAALVVGLIEEGCKIAAVAFLARRIPHTSQMDGLLLGGAVGMGFAALESTGYAFTALLLSQGHIEASIFSTVIRGLIAPFGHGTWTGILGAVLFRQSTSRHFRINGPVIVAYLFVSVLHALWNGLPYSIYVIIPPGIPLSITTLILGVIGIVTLSVLYRRAMIQHMQQPISTLP